MLKKSLIILSGILLLGIFFGCGRDNKVNVIFDPPEITGSIIAPDSIYSKSFFLASVIITDPNGLDVQVRFNWGDGTTSQYTDYAASGSLLEMPYAYNNSGVFEISVTARNRAGLVNDSGTQIHQITILEKTATELINDLMVHNNRLFLTAQSSVNLQLSYQRLNSSGRIYHGYSAKNKRSFIDIPLPVETADIDYQMTLRVETNSSVKDTVFTFLSTNSQYPMLKVDFVDVRQGDGALIQTPEGQNIAIDGGYGSRVPSFSNPAYWNGAGFPFMLNYVIGENVTSFRYLIETHNHMDHWGGLADIRDYGIPYDYYLSPDSPYNYSVGSYLDVNSAVRFRILNIDFPPGVSTSNENNRSVVLRIEYGEIAYLFTGDMESPVENYLVDNGFLLSADVLKVGHHGSRTSSRPAFLEAVFDRYAQIAVISFGTGNPYNHPHDIHRFAPYQVFGTGQPSESFQGDNYHFNTGNIKTYTDGYIVIVSY